MSNVYKIPAKEYAIVDRREGDKVSVGPTWFWKFLESVPLILRNYKKWKKTIIIKSKISSFLSVQYVLVTGAP